MPQPADEQSIQLIRTHLAAGRLADANAACRHALSANPGDADLLHLLGVIALSGGRYDEAVQHLREAIATRPNAPEFHNNLGEAFRRAGRADEAIESYRAALAQNPAYASALTNMALALMTRGDFAAAADAAGRAAQHRPNHVRAYYILGSALEKLGRLDDAIRALARAIQLNPQHAAALKQLSDILERFPVPGERLQELLPHDRNDPRALEQFGTIMSTLGVQESAEEALRQSMRLRSEPSVAMLLATTLERQGKTEQAIDEYQRVQAQSPRDVLRLVAATRVPVIYQSVEEMRTWRQRLCDGLDRLRRENLQVDITNAFVPPLFWTAYQGMNDRDVLRDYARLIKPPPDPDLSRRDPASAAQARLRIGFVSAYFREHSVAQFTKGMIGELSREKFEVIVFSVGHHEDADALFIRDRADAYFELPEDLSGARRQIAAQRLDVLIYPDIGMDDFTYALSFSRLAPRQCATWGHPVTSGVSAIDDYISSALLEADDADAHYTERLVRLPHLPTCYYRPKLSSSSKTLADFGLGDDVHVYGCLQNLFKLTPDFDVILDEILRRDERGMIVVPRGKVQHWERLLRDRLSRTMPRTFERVRFLPRMSYHDYLALSRACPVLLTPIQFGAGVTSYEALAFGTPIVTMPTPYLKGRITFGLYRAMNMMDCVARSPQEYAQIAVSLATEPDMRRHVSQRILNASYAIFDNTAGVRDLEQYLLGG